MKAIVQDRYGDNPDVLHLQEIATPKPGPNAVLIEVRAASLFVGDWHIMAGLPYAIRPSFGLRKPKVRVRGQDVAGTVVAVGPDSRFQLGEDVYGTCEGSFAAVRRRLRRQDRREASEPLVRTSRNGSDRWHHRTASGARCREGASRPVGADRGSSRRRRFVRGPDRQGIRCACHRRVQHGADGPRPLARRRRDHRLHQG